MISPKNHREDQRPLKWSFAGFFLHCLLCLLFFGGNYSSFSRGWKSQRKLSKLSILVFFFAIVISSFIIMQLLSSTTFYGELGILSVAVKSTSPVESVKIVKTHRWSSLNCLRLWLNFCDILWFAYIPIVSWRYFKYIGSIIDKRTKNEHTWETNGIDLLLGIRSRRGGHLEASMAIYK